MKKVLILPSYWPCTTAPLPGAQVKEQTELMADVVDQKVVYCVPGMGVRRFLVFILARLFTGKSLYRRCDDLITGSLQVEGVYYFKNSWLPAWVNRALAIQAYDHLFRKYRRAGWVPDVIHARTAMYAGVFGLALSRKYRIPMVLTENNLLMVNETGKIRSANLESYKNVIENTNRLLMVSQYLAVETQAHGFNIKPLVIGNCIDEKIFKPLPRDVAGSDSRFTIGILGTVGFVKGWPFFFQVIKHLVHELQQRDILVKIAITQVYDNWSREYIPSLIREHQLTEVCTVFRELPRTEIPAFIGSCDVIVSTSIRETFGISICEAMFCGRPVVSTMNGGVMDFLTDDNGRLVHYGDVEHFADALLRIKNRSIAFTPEKIRNSVVNRFSTQAFKEKLYKHYEDVIGG